MSDWAAPHLPAADGAPRWRGWAASAVRAAVAVGLLAGFLAALSLSHPPALLQLHGSPLPRQPAPAFVGLVQADSGQSFRWTAQRGRAVLVFFGYTHCPDVCPLTLQAVAQSLAQLGPLRRDVEVVFVTLDPARDTAAALRAYLDALLPGDAATALRGPAVATATAARQWDVQWRRVDARDGNYWIDHTAAITLVGPHGHWLARYGYAQLAHPRWLADDLRQVLQRR